MTNLLAGGTGAVPTWTAAAGTASGNQYGTGYTTVAGYTAAPSAMTYDDPYLGGRAPEYINWTFGIQRQVTDALAVTATYVGSEGHFLQADSNTGRGYWSNQLDPKYLTLGSHLSDKTLVSMTSDCTTYTLNCNTTALNEFAVAQGLSAFLKPFPFQAISDSFGYVSNANYHGLQVTANMRTWHGLTFNTNFTFSRAIDDGGTFRSGYALPAGTIANHPAASYAADRIERTVSTSNQKKHFVLTAVWDWPLGKTIFAEKQVERAVFGGFKFSGIYQAYSGSPLAITASACQTNPATPAVTSTVGCAPTLNPNFVGSANQNGRWGKGVTYSTLSGNPGAINYVVPSMGGVVAGSPTNVSGPFIAPVSTLGGTSTTLLGSAFAPNYTFGDSPRTAPYNLYGPGNYQLDLAMERSVPLHITAASKLKFRAEWYNITNHTLFAVASTIVGNSTFGQVTVSPTSARKSAQFSARIEF
jgi:hypothetical protein